MPGGAADAVEGDAGSGGAGLEYEAGREGESIMSLPGRVVITQVGHPLCGHEAILRRPRMCDDGGWYEIAGELNAEAMEFAASVLPFGLHVGDDRRQNTLLYPDQYRPAPAPKEPTR